MQDETESLLIKLTNFNQHNGLMVPNLDKFVVFQLLCDLDKKFELTFGNCEVKKVYCTLINKNKALFSNVYQLIVEFENDQKYECVLKLPLINALGEENQQSIIEAHNVECEFYEHFKDVNFLLPQIFAAKKFGSINNDYALILMESFVGKADSLNLYEDIRDGQVLSAARAIAHLQFEAQDPKRRKWWMQKEKSITLDELYSNFIASFYPTMMEKPEFAPLIQQLKPLLNRNFGLYALRELPQKYSAITICHGDYQSHNLLFKTEENNMVGDSLHCVVDYQLCFYGSSLFDLGKFIGMACDRECRERMKMPAFHAYYQELTFLYNSVNLDVPFNKDQAFELYELVFCHTSTVLIEFSGYLEEKYNKCAGWQKRIEKIRQRTLDFTRSVVPLIEKYGLERFEQNE